MRNISRALLLTLLLSHTVAALAQTEDVWTEQRCAELSALSQPDLTTQQQLQQHCTPKTTAADSATKVMPVQLDITAPAQQQPVAESAPQRVQHNSTLETLGSAMLLVLVGFWFWMGRK